MKFIQLVTDEANVKWDDNVRVLARLKNDSDDKILWHDKDEIEDSYIIIDIEEFDYIGTDGLHCDFITIYENLEDGRIVPILIKSGGKRKIGPLKYGFSFYYLGNTGSGSFDSGYTSGSGSFDSGYTSGSGSFDSGYTSGSGSFDSGYTSGSLSTGGYNENGWDAKFVTYIKSIDMSHYYPINKTPDNYMFAYFNTSLTYPEYSYKEGTLYIKLPKYVSLPSNLFAGNTLSLDEFEFPDSLKSLAAICDDRPCYPFAKKYIIPENIIDLFNSFNTFFSGWYYSNPCEIIYKGTKDKFKNAIIAENIANDSIINCIDGGMKVENKSFIDIE